MTRIEDTIGIKELVWQFYPQASPPCWCASTPFGDCVVEEGSGSDSPSYTARSVRMNVVAVTDGLPEAITAAQADYEAKVRSVIIPLSKAQEAHPMTPREAGIQAFYADEGTSNTLQGLNAAFDAYEAAAKPTQDEIVKALEAALELAELSEVLLAVLKEAVSDNSLVEGDQWWGRVLAAIRKAEA